MRNISDSKKLCKEEFKANFRALSRDQRREVAESIRKAIGEEANQLNHSISEDIKHVRSVDAYQLTVKKSHTDHRVFIDWDGRPVLLAAHHADETH